MSQQQLTQYSQVEISRRVEESLCFMLTSATNGDREVQYLDHVTGLPTRTQRVGRRAFLRILVMTMIIHTLLIYKCGWCKRCIYYIWIILFFELGKDSTFYDTIVRVAEINGVPRSLLPIRSKGKGTIAGTVTIQIHGRVVDLRLNNGIVATDDFQRSAQGLDEAGLKLLEIGGVQAPNHPDDLSTEQVAYLSKTVFLIVEKEGIYNDLLCNGLLKQGYSIVILETEGCAAAFHLGTLAFFKQELRTVYGVESPRVLACVDNAPSGIGNVMSNCWELNSKVKAEDELHTFVDCIGPFHKHESAFPNLLLRAGITDNERQVVNQLRRSVHFVNNPDRLVILDSYIEKGYTCQLEYYGRVPLVKWIFKEIQRRVESNTEDSMEIDADAMDTS